MAEVMADEGGTVDHTGGVSGLIEDVVGSSARLTRAAAELSDIDVRAPSGLARWTRGQVLAHLARSADAYVRLLRLAREGAEPGPRTDTAPPTGAVDPMAALPAAELVSEVRRRLARFAAEAGAMPAEAWGRLVTALPGWRHPAWFTLRRCLRELETHHVDLRIGYGTDRWPAPYVVWGLDTTLAALKAEGFPVGVVKATDLGRRWEVSPAGPALAAPGHLLLGWLSGRLSIDGLTVGGHPGALPVPPAWPLPPAPGWGRADGGGGR
ncbi:maleylpyruvate isomerase family mycothiol-dependent enzyme [Streptomyces sp. NPDC002004]